MARERTDRRYPRRGVRHSYVEYSKAGTRLTRMFRPSVQRGPMVDISRSGVQFRTTESLEIGSTLYLTLRLSDMKEAVKVRSEVRWSREERKVGAENYTHVIGAEFIDFTPRAWDLIAAALRE